LAQIETVHTAPWPHCPNNNVFSKRLNWPTQSIVSVESSQLDIPVCYM